METLPESWQINVNQDDIDEIPEFIPISLMWLKFDIYDFITGCKSENQSSPNDCPQCWDNGRQETLFEGECLYCGHGESQNQSSTTGDE